MAMTKAAIQAVLNRFPGQKAEIVGSDAQVSIYVGLSGRYAFFTDDGVAEIKINSSNPQMGVMGMSQTESPFIYTFLSYDDVEIVKVYCGDADMSEALTGLEPVDSNLSIDDIIKAVQAAPVNKALSPRGNLNSAPTEPGSAYGEFKGTAITTDKNGFPEYMKKVLTND